MSRYAIDISCKPSRPVDAVAIVAEAIRRQDPVLLLMVRAEAKRDDRYRCYECDAAMTTSFPRTVTSTATAHFQHPGNAEIGCSPSVAAALESERHQRGIAILYQWLLDQDPGSAPEVNRNLRGTNRRPDLIAWLADRPVTIEYQHSAIKPETARARASEALTAAPGGLNLWVFDRDADKGGRHFAYAEGNQKLNPTKLINLKPAQAALVEAGAQIAWLDSENRLTTPYFSWLDPRPAEPDSHDPRLRKGRPTLGRTVSRYGPWVTTYEVIGELDRVEVDEKHQGLVSPRLSFAMKAHQQAIDAIVNVSHRRRVAAAERARIVAEQERQRAAEQEQQEQREQADRERAAVEAAEKERVDQERRDELERQRHADQAAAQARAAQQEKDTPEWLANATTTPVAAQLIRGIEATISAAPPRPRRHTFVEAFARLFRRT